MRRMPRRGVPFRLAVVVDVVTRDSCRIPDAARYAAGKVPDPTRPVAVAARTGW